MALSRMEYNGCIFVEGPPDQPFLTTADDSVRLIESCIIEGASAVLLYAANMPPAFFDLSSGQAGIILQKMRNYRIRLAIVVRPQEVMFSRLFDAMLADERRDRQFTVVETRDLACRWIEQPHRAYKHGH